MPLAELPVRPDANEALLRRLEWRVIKPLDGLLQGNCRSLMRGQGMDLADLRPYQTADDVRHIDWNVTARLDEPHVRVFTEDRDMNAWFLLDLSASVDFGSSTRSKRSLTQEFVAVLARLFTRHGNRVGAVLWNGRDRGQVVPARASRPHVLHLMRRVQAPTAATAAPPPHGSTTRPSDLLRHSQPCLRRRSTVVVISDFISEPGWERPLGRLAQRHDVVAVRLSDPLERALPDLGLITLRDAESGEQLLVDTQDPGFRRRFAQAAQDRESVLLDALGRAGVDTLELSTEEDLLSALTRFVVLRRHRGVTPRRLQSISSGTHGVNASVDAPMQGARP